MAFVGHVISLSLYYQRLITPTSVVVVSDRPRDTNPRWFFAPTKFDDVSLSLDHTHTQASCAAALMRGLTLVATQGTREPELRPLICPHLSAVPGNNGQ
jgi:hypothetical protein